MDGAGDAPIVASPGSPPAQSAQPAQPHDGPRRGLRPLVGLMLAGYGALVLVGVLPHDSPASGLVSLLAGAAILAIGLPAVGAPRARIVALVGAACVGGTVGYALAARSGWSGPKLAIVAYGLLLMAAAPNLERRVGRWSVAEAVGWSFPLFLAPFSLFALNGSLSSDATGAAAAPLVERLVVAPTAFALRLFGTPVHQVGSTLMLATPRGSLSLGVGLVCAGLYPAVLFAGLVALHAWQDKVGFARGALVLASGLAGLWLLNIARMVLLARIGVRWGMEALQTAHANLGWILFAAFMALFWQVALRRVATAPRPNTA